MKGGLVMALYVIRALLENGWQETDMTVLLCGDEEMSHPFTDAVAQFKKRVQGRMLFLIWNLDALTAASLRVGRERPGQRW